MSRIATKSIALAATAAFTVATPLAFVPSSTAQETPAATTTAAPNAQAIDINRTGRLTIDKRNGEVGSTTPLEGTTFRLERVTTGPLNTAAGWADVSRIAGGAVSAATIEGTPIEKTTDAAGQAVFGDLAVGMYRVTELVNGKYTVAAPFFVTLPLMDNGTPNYTPTISPKNQEIKPTKGAQDTNVNVGDNITYTINAPVPAGDVLRDGTRTISEFSITDPLQSDLSYAANTATVTYTGANGLTDPVADTDYKLTTNTNNTVSVVFTPAGLAKLATDRAANPGLQVVLKFQARVNSIPANGQINNTAEVKLPNRPPIQTVPESTNDGTGNDTRTTYANVQVTKTLNDNAVDDNANGAGAEFQIFACTGADGKYTVEAGAQPVVGTIETGNEKAGATLTAQGAVPSAAVANGYALQFDPEKTYCAVETKAPAKFLINPDPKPLSQTGATPAGRPLYTVTVNDVRDNIWGRLPATGERTMLIMLALGLVLFGGGAAYQLRRKNA
ncbi:SpaH/EbpB family LPXTG-anchored major pilin [Corynebacterium sp. UBA2622]|uniref:SpaH/EbpB family LPXTG-anchored major pilin n=1 Tax=Corynebacterium sp. UBA2622 TaxID=1946393 RepID=UPI0025C49A8E|nr:SpaH/EbpB family LPXTG-anchored major pilin [Corynebacterium sp. UBA2622]